MSLILLEPTTLVAQLVEILNHNFLYLQNIYGGGTGQKYITDFTNATGQQTITHGLDSVNLIVQCWQSDGRLVLPDARIISSSVVQVTFDSAFTGRVVLKRTGARTHVAQFSNATGQHTIVHDLGSLDVLVQCYDNHGNSVICAMQLLTPTALRVTFDVPFTGRVIVTL